MQKKNSSRLLRSIEQAAIALIMSTVLIGLMGCKQDSDPLSSEKAITAFSITLEDAKEGGSTPTLYKGVITNATRTIVVSDLPSSSAATWVVPAIEVSPLAKVSPASGMEVDFTTPQTYTVTAEDGSTQDYLVTVKVKASPNDKAITSFALKGKDGTTVGTVSTPAGDAIAINYEVPWGTDVKWLVPTIVATGASVSPASAVAQDFSEPVRYTVTAQNGTTKEYLVTVTVEAASSDKAITSFGLKTKAGVSVGTTVEVTEAAPEIGDAIAFTVPWGTDVKWLVPTIAFPNTASVSPASAVAQDFSEPVRYIVTAQDDSTKEYLVTVTVEAAKAFKDIMAFSLKTKDGTSVNASLPISDTIVIEFPWGTDIKWLVPTIAVSEGASVSRAAVVPPAVEAPYDFSNPVRYIVTAEDGSTKEYLVTVTKASLTSLDITTEPTITTYALGEKLDLAGLVVEATYSDNDTAEVTDYTVSSLDSSTIGTKTITVTLTRNGVTEEDSFDVTVTGESLALKIELVNDTIVSLFGITPAEIADTAKGIQLSVNGTRKEVVISLTAYSNTDPTTDNVQWNIDGGGSWANASGYNNIVTIKASDYTLGRHYVAFTGTKDDGSGNRIPYSKTFYFTVDID